MATLKDFDYDDIRIIGRGQYGKAHLVTHGVDQESYIAKTIELTCLSKKERETALQEVELLRRLDHPNIVEYKDNFFMGDTLVIIMQFCEGGDLANYIKENARDKQRFQEEQIMHYFVQVLQALQYIHTERILHRDLKTSNLFLTSKKRIVKLGDFGISRVLEGSIEAAITVVGTPYYMSPEVCENKPYTFKSDVWSLGCVLYELCMLKHAFSADNLLGLVYKIVSDKYEPIPKRYPPALNTLIKKMLTKQADTRPSVGNLLGDAYVQSFMNEYVRTGGLCATPAASTASRTGAGASNATGGGHGKAARSGSGGGAYAGTEPAAAPGGRRASGAPGKGPSGHRPRPARPMRPARTTGGSPNLGVETPKEAMARRKREAADRKATELQAATREAVTKKGDARRMKEAEFQTTQLRGGMAVAASSSAPTWRPGSFGVAEDDESNEDIEEALDEMSDESSEEEYEDDFEEDVYTEDDLYELDEELEGERGGRADVLHLSTVREEQDFTRVMCNYEQDLRNAENADRLLGASPPPAVAAGTSALGRSRADSAGAPPTPMAITDVYTRASRLREELMRKMGPEIFQQAFDFLVRARRDNVDERQVRRELEALVGRETYKTYCFDVDQLVFQQTCLAPR